MAVLFKVSTFQTVSVSLTVRNFFQYNLTTYDKLFIIKTLGNQKLSLNYILIYPQNLAYHMCLINSCRTNELVKQLLSLSFQNKKRKI